jgi:cystathionine beta-lyase/cystathionine gamma-synthase
MSEVRNWHRINGLHVSPTNAGLTVESIASLKNRMAQSSQATEALMKDLAANGCTVIHPCLPSHVSYNRNRQHDYLTFAPPMFVLKRTFISKNQLMKKVMGTNGILEWKTSYGGPSCRIDPWPIVKKEEDSTLVRVSVGFEPFDITAVSKSIQSILS